MNAADIQKAITNRYGQKVTDWSIQKGYHKKLKATDSGLMVRYSTDGFINGRQWLETLQQWAEGHTLFEYDPDLN